MIRTQWELSLQFSSWVDLLMDHALLLEIAVLVLLLEVRSLFVGLIVYRSLSLDLSLGGISLLVFIMMIAPIIINSI